MRRIFLDTETTGLDHKAGDRIVEIGCVEMLQRQRSQKHYHVYLNPERTVGGGALAVHGLTDDFLSDKPTFAHVAEEFLELVRGAELLIHNAEFDVGFLNSELTRCKLRSLQESCACIVDTLKLARDIRPGRKNNLDALCSEYGIDNSHRELHGALRDADLLAEVWLALTRGQDSLSLEGLVPQEPSIRPSHSREQLGVKVTYPTIGELAEHERVLREIDTDSEGKTLWRTLT